MPNIQEIADKAEVVVNGYAFTRRADGVHVLNLNQPDKATVFDNQNEVIETTMDDIEISIARKYLLSSLKYMED
jgi:hypothetical protein